MRKCCPKCGGHSGWEANVRVYGWAYEYRDWHDNGGGMEMEKVNYSNPSYVKCQDCGKKVLKP